MHTKDLAKTNHTDSLFGNTLDKHIRNGQDAQTLGIPIGPDTSLLISEIILSAIENNLEKSGKVKLRGYRYSDDYELGCESYAEAENTLAIIQECLNNYELALNPTKTKIIELPGILEASWVSALRSFTFRQGHRSQQYDLFRYFDTAFSLCGANKEDNILRYAIQRTSGVAIDKINWPLYEDLLLQCAMVEPGTLSFVFRQLEKYKSNDYKLTTDKVAEAFNNIIKQHAALGHGGEVAWALWGAISFGARIDEKSALLLADMLDPIVATLALDARSRGLIDGNVLFNKFASLMTKNDLTSENWLVAYEANIKGWLPSLQREDNVLSEPNFRLMKNGGVSFYNPNAPASSPFRFSSSTY